MWIEFRTTFLNFKDKESEFLHVLVGEEVEQLIFFVIDDFLDDRDFILFIKIALLASWGVYVDTIFLGGCHENALIIVQFEELWLSVQWVLKFVKSSDCLVLEVESKDLVDLGKKNFFSIVCAWNDSEMEIHRHLLEMFDVFHDNSVDEIAVASITLPSVDEQLVGLLLVHNQVLSTNDG